MSNHNAITYICHINTSDLLGNAAYKKKLFNTNGLNGIGLTNIESIEREKDRLRQFRSDISDLAIVYEGDSHAINEIGIKNTWIKMSNLQFKSLKKAFLNHQVCIYTEEQKLVEKYIKGLVVFKGKNGFLSGNPNGNVKEQGIMSIDFSQDLNCIIGGRGSGKSTVLNIIETVYSMECDNWELLNYIAQYERIYSLFIYNMKEYLLEFIPQKIIRGSYNSMPMISRNSYFEENNIYKLKPQWYNLFEIVNISGKNQYKEVESDKIKDLLKDVFRRSYNINKLVDKISNNKISEYINKVMTYNVEYEEINTYIKKGNSVASNRVLKIIRENIDNILNMIERRRNSFSDVVKEFNEANKEILCINYEPMYEMKAYFDEFIKIFDENSNKSREKYISNTFLTWGNVQDYFCELIGRRNFFEILKLLLNKNFNEMNKIVPIEEFQSIDESYHTVELGLVQVNKENRKEIYTLSS